MRLRAIAESRQSLEACRCEPVGTPPHHLARKPPRRSVLPLRAARTLPFQCSCRTRALPWRPRFHLTPSLHHSKPSSIQAFIPSSAYPGYSLPYLRERRFEASSCGLRFLLEGEMFRSKVTLTAGLVALALGGAVLASAPAEAGSSTGTWRNGMVA